jgi:hypothetical protein
MSVSQIKRKFILDGAIDASKVDSSIALTSQLDAEITRASLVEGSLQVALGEEYSRAVLAEATLQANLAAEYSRAYIAEQSLNTLAGNLDSNLTVLSGSLDEETTRAVVAETSLYAAVAAEYSRAFLAEQSLASSGAGAVADEYSRAVLAETTLQMGLDSEVSRALAAEATFLLLDGTRPMTGALDMNSETRQKIINLADGVNAYDAVNKAQLDAVVNGLVWLDPILDPNLISDNLATPPGSPDPKLVYIVAATATGAWTGLEGHAVRWDAVGSVWVDLGLVAVGDRFGVAFEGGTATGGLAGKENDIVVVATLSPLTYTTITPNNGQAVFVNEDNSYSFGHNYVYSSTSSSWIEFAGPGAIEAGVALAWSGNILNVLVDGTTITTVGDQLTVSTNVLNSITNEYSRAVLAETTLQANLVAEYSRAVLAETTLQANLAAEYSRAFAAEATKLPLAGGTMTGSIVAGVGGLAIGSGATAFNALYANYVQVGTTANWDVSNRTFSDGGGSPAISYGYLDRIWIHNRRIVEVADGNQLGDAVNLKQLTVVEGSGQAAIAAEYTRAYLAETTLQANLAAEYSRAYIAEQSLAMLGTASVAEEYSRAVIAETSLYGAVAAEYSRAYIAEQSLAMLGTASVAEEYSRAVIAETSLYGAVAAEYSRAYIAEQSLAAISAGAVADEYSRAVIAETSLYGAVADEYSRAMIAEGSLSSRVLSLEADHYLFDKEKHVLGAAEISLQAVTLAHNYEVDSLVVNVGRLMLNAGASDDYTLSVVGGVTVVTFANDVATGGPEALEAGDILYVSGAYRI